MNPQNWEKTEHQARWVLAHADQSPPTEHLRGMGLQLRLWHYAHSGDHLSWSLILPVRDYRERRGVVREVTWDRSSDWKQAMTPIKKLKRRALPAPSVQIRDAEVDWAELAPFLDATGRLPTKSLPGDASWSSKDDVSGLEGFRSLAHIHLEWAGNGPRGWGTRVAWFDRFRRVLARIMRERDTQAREG